MFLKQLAVPLLQASSTQDTQVNYTHATDSQALATKLLGKPYVSGARGPESFDCWGLVTYFYKEVFAVELPLYPNEDPFNVKRVSGLLEKGAHSSDWVEIKKPEHGCVVAMSRSKVFHHVGIWLEIDDGLCLHAYDGMQVMAHTIQQLKWQNISKIAFFKHGKSI